MTDFYKKRNTGLKWIQPYFKPEPLPEVLTINKSPIRREQDLNLSRTWVKALLNDDVQQW